MTPEQSNKGKAWSFDEHLVAFNLYCRLPFGKLNQSNPEIKQLAGLLGRTPSSIAMKLGNFASLDPSLQQRGIRGLSNSSKGVEDIWALFAENPEKVAFESERLFASLRNITVENAAEIDLDELPHEGKEREALVMLRANQNFFRRRVLSAFEYRCCVTGLAIPDLLVASHIVPWSRNKVHRLNPRNGLCLNALHDRAFDRGLMWVEEGFVIRFSSSMKAKAKDTTSASDWLLLREGQSLQLPEHFAPNPDFLQWHRESVAIQ